MASTTIADSASSITTPSTTSLPAPSSTTTGVRGPGDFEGQRYDFGAITKLNLADGVYSVTFDRQQLYTDDGSLQSGTDFSEEPILFGNTDVPYINETTRTRRFVLAQDVEVLRIADPVPCASDEVVADPIWEPIEIEALMNGAWKDRLMDTLTFSTDGDVTRIRLSTGC